MKKVAKGFTLVELMIVVAIIGILAAIAIPNFMKYQLRAKYGELPTNINGWFKAEESLRQAERTIPTAVAGGDGTTTGQYFVFAAALPTLTSGACTVAAAPTSKKPWATADIAMTSSIDWVVEGSTYGCYLAGVAGGVGQYGTAVLLEAGADIDGDGMEVAVTLSKPIIDATGAVTTEVAAAPLSGVAGVAPYSTLQRWDVTANTNVGTDNVF